ncbi:hypothetical protein V8E36_007645 [Tilletia maclaganii]
MRRLSGLAERVGLLEQGTSRATSSPMERGDRQDEGHDNRPILRRTSTPRADSGDVSVGVSGFGTRVEPPRVELDEPDPHPKGPSLSQQLEDPSTPIADKTSLLRRHIGLGAGKPDTVSDTVDDLWRMEYLCVKDEMPNAPDTDRFHETQRRVHQSLKGASKVKMLTARQSQASSERSDTKSQASKLDIRAASLVPKLTETNYEHWRAQLWGIIIQAPIASKILLGEEYNIGDKPEDPYRRSKDYDPEVDRRLAGIILVTLSPQLQATITDPLLRKGIQKGSIYFRALTEYIRKGSRTQQEPGEKVAAYGARLLALYGQLYDINGVQTPEIDKLSQFLRHVSPRFNTYVAAIEAQIDIGGESRTLQDVISFFTRMEEKAQIQRQENVMTTPSQAIARIAEEDGKDETREEETSDAEGGDANAARFNGTCNYCCKYGHTRRNCWQWKADVDSGIIKADDRTAKAKPTARPGANAAEHEAGEDDAGGVAEAALASITCA